MNLEDYNLKHIAIIMDGNGRWAEKKGLDRTAGHAAGEHSLSKIIDWSIQNNLKWLTVYAFSTENWSRSNEEVDYLMFFNRDLLTRRRDEFNEKGVRFFFIGDLEDNMIPDENKKLMRDTESLTGGNDKLNLVFAFNYGSEKEIYNAAYNLGRKHYRFLKPSAWFFTRKHVEENFNDYLYLPQMPNPDLLIRTAGEKRLSNFLLLQLSYTELMFVETLWPDFNEENMEEAVKEFRNRNRKYGGI